MNQTWAAQQILPVDSQFDPEMISIRAQLDQKYPLDELVREGSGGIFKAGNVVEGDASIAVHDHRQGK